MKNDQIFTPAYIVKKMLDDIEYNGDNLDKTIFEPSFGAGAFLTEIVSRILARGVNIEQTLDNIYGCEIDPILYQSTIQKLNQQLAAHNITYDWKHLTCGDTLLYPDMKFDYIAANPPFIRIHDLPQETRDIINQKYQFGQGNTDLYVIFMELGLQHLKENGKMVYITPNSWMYNSSQKKFRECLCTQGLIESITNYHTLPVFGDILTYTAVTVCSHNNETFQYTYMNDEHTAAWSRNVSLNEFKSGIQCLANPQDIALLECIKQRDIVLSDICAVQYGVATNADKVYVVNPDANIEDDMLCPLIKASTLDTSKKIIFPYVWDKTLQKYIPLTECQLDGYPKCRDYLLKNKQSLLTRDMDIGAQWFQFARSQGINTSRAHKFVLKHILHPDQERCEFMEVDENTIVYSGMFIVPKDTAAANIIRNMLESRDFCQYLKIIGKDMAGGYKTFNTKAVKEYRI